MSPSIFFVVRDVELEVVFVVMEVPSLPGLPESFRPGTIVTVTIFDDTSVVTLYGSTSESGTRISVFPSAEYRHPFFVL